MRLFDTWPDWNRPWEQPRVVEYFDLQKPEFVEFVRDKWNYIYGSFEKRNESVLKREFEGTMTPHDYRVKCLFSVKVVALQYRQGRLSDIEFEDSFDMIESELSKWALELDKEDPVRWLFRNSHDHLYQIFELWAILLWATPVQGLSTESSIICDYLVETLGYDSPELIGDAQISDLWFPTSEHDVVNKETLRWLLTGFSGGVTPPDAHRWPIDQE